MSNEHLCESCRHNPLVCGAIDFEVDYNEKYPDGILLVRCADYVARTATTARQDDAGGAGDGKDRS